MAVVASFVAPLLVMMHAAGQQGKGRTALPARGEVSPNADRTPNLAQPPALPSLQVAHSLCVAQCDQGVNLLQSAP